MKKLGQHFLSSPSLIKKIICASQISSDSLVVEIGPGKGALTKKLLETGCSVLAIEKDAALVERLEGLFKEEITTGGLVLLKEDVRNLTWKKHLQKKPYFVVANIPYYITGSILRTLLTFKNPPKQITLVVQKEVAERIARSKKESLLSLSVKFFGTPRYEFTIPRRMFRPAPKVDSALLTITDIQSHKEKYSEHFFSLIHTAFEQKRKVLLKKFNNYPDIQKKLIALGVSTNDRAEDVPIDVWKKL